MIRKRDKLHQVFVTLVVFGQKDQVVIFAALGGFVMAVEGGKIDLGADDRLKAGLLKGFVKLDSTVHIAVVSDGTAGHAHIFDGVGQLFDLDQTV